MPTDPNAHSSDLDRAKALTRALRPDAASATAKPQGEPASGYIKFRAAPVQALNQAPNQATPPPAKAQIADEPPPNIDVFGADSWEALLDWVVRVSGCEQAFVIDAQGLVIAQGGMAIEEVERVGARLQMALEQARKLTEGEAAAPSVSIGLGSTWLSGFPIALAGAGDAILGLLGPEAIGAERRAVVERGFRGATGPSDA
jgi:hypothetical protein